jgi:hypothetical protein
MASLPHPGASALVPLTDEQLALLISLSSSIAPPPQCTMNDVHSILHKVSASLAQCRLSLALACSRAALDVTRDDGSQVCRHRDALTFAHATSFTSAIARVIAIYELHPSCIQFFESFLFIHQASIDMNLVLIFSMQTF